MGLESEDMWGESDGTGKGATIEREVGACKKGCGWDGTPSVTKAFPAQKEGEKQAERCRGQWGG